MRVFLDTNVLFSGLYSPKGQPSAILDSVTARHIDLVTSVDVLVELTRNLRLKAPQLLASLSSFLVAARPEFVDPRDEDIQRYYREGFETDAPIIAAAINAGVDYFCTGDRRVLQRARAGELADLNVVSPAEVVRLLEQ